MNSLFRMMPPRPFLQEQLPAFALALIVAELYTSSTFALDQPSEPRSRRGQGCGLTRTLKWGCAHT
jgi:hypothetical protein